MMHRASLNMLASSNGGRKRKAPEGHREMTHSPPPQGFPITRNQRAGAGAGAGACFGAPAPRFPTPQRRMPSPPRRFPTPQRQMPSPTPLRQMPSPPRRFSTPQRQMPSPQRQFPTPQRQMPSPRRRFPTPPQQMMAPPPLPPLNQQLHLDRPEASSSRAPAPLLPAPPQQMMAPPPLNLHLHLDQPEEASSSRAPPPYFDTVLRLSVTPHAPPQTEQGFKEDSPPPANPNLHKDFIDQALKRNNDGVREMLEEICKRQHAAEEKAAKKLKEMDEEIVEVRTKNGELEAMLASYRTQAMDMAERLTALKETNAALNAALHEATQRRGGGGGDGAEEAQSSSLDPDQMVVVRISCKICWRGPATMMACPCRHLCMCNNCARTTNCCPICNATFQDCMEIKFY